MFLEYVRRYQAHHLPVNQEALRQIRWTIEPHEVKRVFVPLSKVDAVFAQTYVFQSQTHTR